MQPFAEMRSLSIVCFARTLGTAAHGQLQSCPVSAFGSPGEANTVRIGIFKVYGKSETEIVLGEDDKHLDFRLSVLRTPDLSPTLGGQLTVSTVVHCHNLLGRAYIFVIAPFHRLVVKASLRRAAHIGWPKAGTR
jgi:hypothetical protein